jgi:hypothetical protein
MGWLILDPPEWDAIAEDLKITARRIARRYDCPIKETIGHWAAFLASEGKSPQQVQDMTVQAEFFWPEGRHWSKAEQERRRTWEMKTLAAAAREILIKEDDPSKVSGKHLAPLLFRNPESQSVYHNREARQEDTEKAEARGHPLPGLAYMTRPAGYQAKPHARPDPEYGERGISRAEFFKRYNREDIAKAKKAALIANAPDVNVNRDKDVSNMTRLDGALKHEKEEPAQRIDQDWSDRHNERLKQNSPKIEAWLASLSEAHREIAQEALNNPFSDERRHKKAAEPQKRRVMPDR